MRDRRFTYIYGPPASGKTHLAFHVARVSASLGLEPVVVATEAGTLLYARHHKTEAPVVFAYGLEDMVAKILENAAKGRFVIVDTINSYYRHEAGLEGGSMLALASSVLASSGGLAIGQARAPEGSPGLGILDLYAHVLGFIEKSGRLSRLVLVRPERRVLAFRVVGGGEIEWV